MSSLPLTMGVDGLPTWRCGVCRGGAAGGDLSLPRLGEPTCSGLDHDQGEVVGDDVVQIARDPRSLALDGQAVHPAGRRNLSPAHLAPSPSSRSGSGERSAPASRLCAWARRNSRADPPRRRQQVRAAPASRGRLVEVSRLCFRHRSPSSSSTATPYGSSAIEAIRASPVSRSRRSPSRSIVACSGP
jgi:hypothetical protein